LRDISAFFLVRAIINGSFRVFQGSRERCAAAWAKMAGSGRSGSENGMKRRVVVQVAALVLCATPWLTAAAKDTQLNVYNWSDYIAKDTIPNFTKQTGVQVKYDNYDSDDTLQAKLLTGNSGYDIVVPTSNYAGKQIAAGI
jgi:hypothetical protein